MTEWREVALGDLCERVTVGHVGKMVDNYVEDGVPFLRSQNINPFRINTAGMLQIDENFHQRLSKSILRAGDVAIVRTGYPGTAAVIPCELDGSNCADLVIVTPSNDLNPHMLAGLLNSTWGRSAVGGHLVGAAQQHFNVGSAKALRVRLPDRATQDRIAAVLCSLHDLIENNRRRVEVLEEMAQTIYREWFVHFRFPGHEDVTFVDSDLGPIPEGWKVLALRELTSVVTRGVAPKYADNGAWIVLNQRCIRGGTISLAPSRRHDHAVMAKKQLEVGDVLINSTGVGTLGRVAQWRGEGAATADSHVTIVRSSGTTDHAWLAQWAKSSEPHFESLGTGSTGQTELRRADVEGATMAAPPMELRTRFGDLTEPWIALADALQSQAHTLASTRDLLLPKLVTGQIDISDLDLDALVEEASI